MDQDICLVEFPARCSTEKRIARSVRKGEGSSVEPGLVWDLYCDGHNLSQVHRKLKSSSDMRIVNVCLSATSIFSWIVVTVCFWRIMKSTGHDFGFSPVCDSIRRKKTNEEVTQTERAPLYFFFSRTRNDCNSSLKDRVVDEFFSSLFFSFHRLVSCKLICSRTRRKKYANTWSDSMKSFEQSYRWRRAKARRFP